MSESPRILIAGIGNIFLGDDAFGVEVAQRLLRIAMPSNVRVVDFGIRGIDLTYALLDHYDAVILVDAAPRGHPPGTLSVLKPELPETDQPDLMPGPISIDTHSMDPLKIMRLVKQMGGGIGHLLVVACEPVPPVPGNDDDMSMGLSPPVAAAVDEAVVLVVSLVEQLIGETTRLCNTPILEATLLNSR